MKVYEIYFSPTGGTKKVADIISGAWRCEKEAIDLLVSRKTGTGFRFAPEDICVIAVPSFGGRVPGPAVQRLREMNGNGARAVLTAVYGNRDFEDTLIELKDVLDSRGFTSAGAVAAIAEHSIFRQFAAGRPDDEDKKELERFAGEIREHIESDNGYTDLCVPGNRPYKAYGGVPFKPKADKRCNRCGLCVRECPADAIAGDNPASVIRDKCVSCMHCISVCPQNARSISNMSVSAAARKMKKSFIVRKDNQLFIGR